MPILEECGSCEREGGYATSTESENCARCENAEGAKPKKKASKKKSKDESEN